MKEFKRVVPMYSFYDRTGIQNYLQEQAAKGWMLEKVGTVLWRFRRMDPRDLKFSVVYFPEADACDPVPGEGEQTFREFCEHAGWHFVASQAQMQIFYSTSVNPVPIDTDPAIEVQNIHKSMKKSELLSHWMLLVTAVLQVVVQCLGFTTNPLGYLSWNVNLYFILFWPSMILMCTARLICYYRWYRRAKRAAEEGEFLASRGFHCVEAVWALIAAVGLMACALPGKNKASAAIVFIGVVVGLGILGVSIAAREYFKKRGYTAAQNKVRTIIVTIVAVLILTAIVTAGVFYVVENTDDDQSPAIGLSDLMDVEYETLMLEDSESILLGRQRVTHYNVQKLPMTELQYQVLHVKADFLYEMCREKVLTEGYFELYPIDGEPWGAVEVYEAWRNEELQGYELCYEDYIVCLWPSWEMTEAQMAIIGNIFK